MWRQRDARARRLSQLLQMISDYQMVDQGFLIFGFVVAIFTIEGRGYIVGVSQRFYLVHIGLVGFGKHIDGSVGSEKKKNMY